MNIYTTLNVSKANKVKASSETNLKVKMKRGRTEFGNENTAYVRLPSTYTIDRLVNCG